MGADRRRHRSLDRVRVRDCDDGFARVSGHQLAQCADDPGLHLGERFAPRKAEG